MRKDHNKYVFAKRRKSTGNNWRLLGLAVAVVSSLSIVLFLGCKYNPNLSAIAEEKLISFASFLYPKSPAKSKVEVKSVVPVGNSDEIHFDFYSELPKMQVSVPVVSEAKAPPAKVLASETKIIDKYIVEIGTFPNKNAAGESRVSLLLGGIEADIVSVSSGKDEQYRLQQGPFSTVSAANSALKKLQKKAIAAEIKKLN